MHAGRKNTLGFLCQEVFLFCEPTVSRGIFVHQRNRQPHSDHLGHFDHHLILMEGRGGHPKVQNSGRKGILTGDR